MDHESKLVWFGFLYISEFSVDLDVYEVEFVEIDRSLSGLCEWYNSGRHVFA